MEVVFFFAGWDPALEWAAGDLLVVFFFFREINADWGVFFGFLDAEEGLGFFDTTFFLWGSMVLDCARRGLAFTPSSLSGPDGPFGWEKYPI